MSSSVHDCLYWREDSIKTRIETLPEILMLNLWGNWREDSIKTRIETIYPLTVFFRSYHWREDSIKTRIETKKSRQSGGVPTIEEKIPLKQGLKHLWVPLSDPRSGIEEKIPLKQGLKPGYHKAFVMHAFHWREDSIKTRIETW